MINKKNIRSDDKNSRANINKKNDLYCKYLIQNEWGKTTNGNMSKLKMINRIIFSFVKGITLEKKKRQGAKD